MIEIIAISKESGTAFAAYGNRVVMLDAIKAILQGRIERNTLEELINLGIYKKCSIEYDDTEDVIKHVKYEYIEYLKTAPLSNIQALAMASMRVGTIEALVDRMEEIFIPIGRLDLAKKAANDIVKLNPFVGDEPNLVYRLKRILAM